MASKTERGSDDPLTGGSSSSEGREVKDTEIALIVGMGVANHYHL